MTLDLFTIILATAALINSVVHTIFVIKAYFKEKTAPREK